MDYRARQRRWYKFLLALDSPALVTSLAAIRPCQPAALLRRVARHEAARKLRTDRRTE